MKNILRILLAALSLAASPNSLAQADLIISIFNNGFTDDPINAMPTNGTNVSAQVSNRGDQASLPIRLRFWVSIDA